MNPTPNPLWPAQEPRRDFAARTVEAMLSAVPVARIGRRRPKLVLYLSMAALFATGTALALVGARRHSQVRVAPDGNDVIAVSEPSISMRVQPMAADAVVSALPTASSSQRKPPLNGSGRSVKLAPAPSSRIPMPPRRPACQCERGYSDFICDCY